MDEANRCTILSNRRTQGLLVGPEKYVCVCACAYVRVCVHLEGRVSGVEIKEGKSDVFPSYGPWIPSNGIRPFEGGRGEGGR